MRASLHLVLTVQGVTDTLFCSMYLNTTIEGDCND
jgi:hypothetical protein